jgi:hypothetical protein
MSIKSISSQRYEEISSADRPRIGADAPDATLRGRRRVPREDLDADDFSQFSHRKKRHALLSSL